MILARTLTAIAVVAAGAAADAQSRTQRIRVTAPDGTAVARARITVTVDDTATRVRTGEDGWADVPVPAPPYVLRVVKAGYAVHELRVARAPAAPLTILLAPGATISGRVSNADGAAIADAAVLIRRLEPREAPQPAERRVTTDDRGEYRAGALLAGRYAIVVERGPLMPLAFVLETLPDADRNKLAFSLSQLQQAERDRAVSRPPNEPTVVVIGPGEDREAPLVHASLPSEVAIAELRRNRPQSTTGVVSGTLLDEFGDPAEGMQMALIKHGSTYIPSLGTHTDDRGQFRIHGVVPGRYVVVAILDQSPTPPPDAQLLPVYFPQTFDINEATPIDVGPSQHVEGIDFTAVEARGVRLFGTVGSSSGELVGLWMTPAATQNGPRSTRLARVDGSEWELRNVAPGNYVLQATTALPGERPEFTRPPEFASVRVVVGSDDVGPITVTTLPTSTLHGRIQLDAETATIRPTDVTLSPVPADPDEAPVGNSIRRDALIEADWTFTFTGLTTPSRFRLTRVIRGWWLKSMLVGGTDAAAEPVRLGAPGDSRDDVVVVLSNRAGRVTGTVTRGNADTRTAVVAFDVDRRRWFPGSPFVTSVAAQANGQFTLSLPPGDYFIAAIEPPANSPPPAMTVVSPDGRMVANVDQPAGVAAEMLAPLARVAERVTVIDGQAAAVELRLVRSPR